MEPIQTQYTDQPEVSELGSVCSCHSRSPAQLTKTQFVSRTHHPIPVGRTTCNATMADKNPASKTLGEQAADTVNSVRNYVAGAVAGGPDQPKTNTNAPAASTGPTIGSSLGDAWESVKQATGLAGEKGAETAAVGKAQAENTRNDASAAVSQKAGDARIRMDNAKANAGQQAENAKVTATGLMDDARKNVAGKIEPKNNH